MKAGDRVRLVPGRSSGLARDGALGTVTYVPKHPLWIGVRWDCNRGVENTPPRKYLERIEEVMPKINTTKPLIVSSTSSPPAKATFITETSEGHYLVSAENKTFHWAIFDKDGVFVRSSDTSGGALKLSNPEEEIKRFYAIDPQNAGLGGNHFKTLSDVWRDARNTKQALEVRSKGGLILWSVTHDRV